jgi:hypothetical protein
MAPPLLTDLGRRVLCHLPIWAQDEAAFVELEGGPENSIRSYSLEDLTVRLAEDQSIAPTLTAPQVLASLTALKDAGLASDSSGAWKMLKLGKEALVAPIEPEKQVPGEVVLELNPAIGIAGGAA